MQVAPMASGYIIMVIASAVKKMELKDHGSNNRQPAVFKQVSCHTGASPTLSPTLSAMVATAGHLQEYRLQLYRQGRRLRQHLW